MAAFSSLADFACYQAPNTRSHEVFISLARSCKVGFGTWALSKRQKNFSAASCPSVASNVDFLKNIPHTVFVSQVLASALGELLSTRRVWICLGSGGVGKTTLSATLGITSALEGKKVLVLTIDPARRLADALGILPLTAKVQNVSLGSIHSSTLGQLDIMMVEQKPAFDEVVHRYVMDPPHAHRLFHNPMYQQISSTLPGAHEYAAMSVLYDWVQKNFYDIIVLDTPPFTHALDFLQAPQNVSQVVTSPVLQWLLQAHTAGPSWVGWGGTWLLRTLSRFTGSAFLRQAGEFLADFMPILKGLQQQAEQVHALLHSSQVGYLLVGSPAKTHLVELQLIHASLQQQCLTPSGIFINRVHTASKELIDPIPSWMLLQSDTVFSGWPTEQQMLFKEALVHSYKEWHNNALSDRKAIRSLCDSLRIPVFLIPRFSQDIQGIGSLLKIHHALTNSSV